MAVDTRTVSPVVGIMLEGQQNDDEEEKQDLTDITAKSGSVNTKASSIAGDGQRHGKLIQNILEEDKQVNI